MLWYSMKAVFFWEQENDKLPRFERRTTVCSAPDKRRAVEVLLGEADEYISDSPILFSGEYTIQELNEAPGEQPIEVAHEMTIGVDLGTGDLIEPSQFIERFWERSRVKSCEVFGFEHAWHNRDGKTSACYNCEEVREGRLWEDEKGE